VKTTVFRARRALRGRLKDFVSEQPGEDRLESRFHKESRSHKGL